MIKDDFIKELFHSGKVSDKEILKYLLKNYFLKGYSLDDFEDDLTFKCNTSLWYAKAVREEFETKLNNYSK